MTTTLVLFCRRPRPGVGKRRIAATLGPARTLRLAEHLLAAALEDASQWSGPVVIAPADAADAAWAGQLLERPCQVVAQRAGNLGERLNALDQALRQAGQARCIYIGSDAPILDGDYYALAVKALETHDVVLGPADDGGVTLMGSRRPWPELAGLPWSSDKLCHALELICVKDGLTINSLEGRYDIDHAKDLPRLFSDLENDTRAARQKLRHWLAESGLL